MKIFIQFKVIQNHLNLISFAYHQNMSLLKLISRKFYDLDLFIGISQVILLAADHAKIFNLQFSYQ
jgi:hypothetical protein